MLSIFVTSYMFRIFQQAGQDIKTLRKMFFGHFKPWIMSVLSTDLPALFWNVNNVTVLEEMTFVICLNRELKIWIYKTNSNKMHLKLKINADTKS